MPFNLPNILTVGRIVLIFIALVLATNSGIPGGVKVKSDDIEMILRYIAYALSVIAGITDLFDGYLARKWNQVTDFGALMDPLADKIFVTTTMLILVEFHLIAAWVAAVVIAREFMVTGLRLLAVKQGKVISADKFGKLKTFLQMVMLFIGGLVWIHILDLNMTICGKLQLRHCWSVLLWGIVIVTVGSGLNYFIKNRDLIAEKKSQA
ncbi:MAG: CDP-diacylglycerol--glycerol-3-phosphate 3-phosphatidyltransferase [Lentisphaeria bacterium]|nr:CDP-diacylglycerol--glycerol-3-phosphate 3-phosphatidyltransferase [Lentisphaeria bacterium]